MILEAGDLALGTRIRGVSARLNPGTITAICGPNGAGKSTFLELLAGLAKPTHGAARLNGTDIASLHPRERAKIIGYLPQDHEIAWDVSVASLVALGRMPHGDAGGMARARALAALDLEEFANRPVSTLSGGERARALLARVLAGEPRWILADEPLAALDLGHQLTLLRHLRAEAERGAGIVLVVHNLALAMNHADRVLVLNSGELVADGPPETALQPETIRRVWDVPARWLGEPGARALVAG